MSSNSFPVSGDSLSRSNPIHPDTSSEQRVEIDPQLIQNVIGQAMAPLHEEVRQGMELFHRVVQQQRTGNDNTQIQNSELEVLRKEKEELTQNNLRQAEEIFVLRRDRDLVNERLLVVEAPATAPVIESAVRPSLGKRIWGCFKKVFSKETASAAVKVGLANWKFVLIVPASITVFVVTMIVAPRSVEHTVAAVTTFVNQLISVASTIVVRV